MSLLSNLNQYQRQAVKHFQGPALVLAGAGSGKTRCLVHRAAYLIKHHQVEPDSIVLLTFTNKAAGEMKQRIDNLLQGQVKIGFAGTFHSFGARLLRRFGPFLGRDQQFIIYDDKDSRSLVKDLIKDLGLTKEVKISQANYYIHQTKTNRLSLEDRQLLFPEKAKFLETLYRAYEKALKQANAFDFGDLLVKVLELFDAQPEVVDQLNQQYKYFLIDEYQDTNYVQYVLIKALTRQHKNLFVVGDFCQAIYGFRGADYQNIDRLRADFTPLTVIELPVSYRCAPPILTAASQVIKHNHSHPTLTLKPANSTKGHVTLLSAYDDKHEPLLVIRRVIELLEADTSPGQISILYRTHAQSRPLEEVLVRSGLGYHIVGGWRFFERKEIKDLIAYLRLFINPADPVAYKRVVTLGKRRLKRFWQWADKAKNHSPAPDKLLTSLIEAIDYTGNLDPKVPEDKARLDNIAELVNLAGTKPDVLSLLETASLMTASQIDTLNRYQAADDKINLMTVHAAKGLEFDTVFITGVEEGLFPHFLSTDNGQVEEERRLFYVALTRARSGVYLSLAARRLIWGRYKNRHPSRFLSEIPEEVLEIEEL